MPKVSREIEILSRQQLELEKRREELARELPHLYRWKWYHWAKEFFESKNKMNLLVAANQVSKSSTQIRKAIHWATCIKIWPELWPNRTPSQFWYLYPEKATATREFKHKWVPEFLPSGSYKDHPLYGWKETYGEKRMIESIEFNSGVIIYFRTYKQDASALQAGSCDAIFADEELPENLYDELKARLFGTKGYFHMVFTATLNQLMWKRAMEGRGDAELFPDASKQQVSMRDCITYIDGTPGAYTEEYIQEIERGCKSETERQRRVDGRFVTEEGLKYSQFDGSRHFVKPFALPSDWKKYCAVDIGTGGKGGHPPAMVFVGVRPDHRYAVVYKTWRGDDGRDYTNGDVLNKFIEVRGSDICVLQRFDQHAKDFGIIAQRVGESFLPSEKSHALGEDAVNTLFKNDMLFIMDTEENHKLGGELSSLMKDTAKQKAKDDLCDGLRYCVIDIPWDWEALRGVPTEEERNKKDKEVRVLTPEEQLAHEIDERRGLFEQPEPTGWQELEEELEFWDEQYG